MTDKQLKILIDTIEGKSTELVPAFIIDSPWLPNWAGMQISDYFSSEELWFQSHLHAAQTFPDTIFLPGFWSEFGMCTEPSAFGARCSFPENEFPHAHKVLRDLSDLDHLSQPKVNQDGLLPFVIKRLQHYRKRMEQNGYKIRFSVSRGPLNIASYLMGTTEFLTAIMMEPEKSHRLIRQITDFLHDWHDYQKKCFPEIEGILLLDDIIGFLSKEQFSEFGVPYFKELYNRPLKIKFLHNDAPCRESAPLLNEMGVNLFNMGVDVHLKEIAELTSNSVCLLGNLAPRDVLAAQDSEEVYRQTIQLFSESKGQARILPSCGGGMPPGVSTENITAFINAIKHINDGKI